MGEFGVFLCTRRTYSGWRLNLLWWLQLQSRFTPTLTPTPHKLRCTATPPHPPTTPPPQFTTRQSLSTILRRSTILPPSSTTAVQSTTLGPSTTLLPSTTPSTTLLLYTTPCTTLSMPQFTTLCTTLSRTTSPSRTTTSRPSVPLTTRRPGVWRMRNIPPMRSSTPCSITMRVFRLSTRTCWPTPRTAWTG